MIVKMETVRSAAEHLSAEQCEDYVWKSAPLSPEDAAHLISCVECRQEVAVQRMLAGELAIAQQSQPSPEALDRYQRLFAQARSKPSNLERLVTWVRATLAWDGRQSLALQDIRNNARHSYRVLFTSAEADVELLITPQPTSFSVDGEFLAVNTSMADAALVQLVPSTGLLTGYETEAAAGGHFRMDHVQPGLYTLWIEPQNRQGIKIEGLELR
jgi:hypothetical protein